MSFMSTWFVIRRTNSVPFLIKLKNIVFLCKIQLKTTAATQTETKKNVLRKKRIKINEHYNKMGLIVNLLQKFRIQRIQNDRFISHSNNNRSFK